MCCCGQVKLHLVSLGFVGSIPASTLVYKDFYCNIFGGIGMKAFKVVWRREVSSWSPEYYALTVAENKDTAIDTLIRNSVL